jgi:hypothetical protein
VKRILSAIGVLVLLAAVSITAFASDITDTESSSEHEVRASYEAGAQNRTVISVDISWDQMFFTYKGASESVWDPQKHQYVGGDTKSGWAPGDAAITITNHSNTIIQANIGYTPEAAYGGIRMHFTDPAPYVGSACTSLTEAGTPCTVTIYAVPDGELPAGTEDHTRIGTITVKVTADIAPETVLDTIITRTGMYAAVNFAELSRGGVCFGADTDVNVLQTLLDDTAAVLYDAGKTDAERNQALNRLITAYYSALEIKQ